MSSRFVLFPLVDMESWSRYKAQLSNFWTVEEMDMAKDVVQFRKLDEDTRHYISHVLGFFAASDGIVAKNVDMNFTGEVEKRGWTEALIAYQFQIMMENIHQEAYSTMIDNLVDDQQERARLFNAIENINTVKEKAEWAIKWMGEEDGFENLPQSTQEWFKANYDSLDDEKKQWVDKPAPTFAERLVAFAAIEGIFFSGSFCAIYWLKCQKKILPGLCKFNEFIARDEGMHQEFACSLYKKLCTEEPESVLSKEKILEIVTNAVEIEKRFVAESLPVGLIGMNADLMQQYIEFVADRLLLQLGVEQYHYHSKNPFDWMELLSMDNKTNFFEERVTEYAKRGVGDAPAKDGESNHNTIRFDVSF